MKKVLLKVSIMFALIFNLVACGQISTQIQDEEVSLAVNFDEILPMEVHFIDVGQGDCSLIKCGDEYMLIDAGTDDSGTAIQLYLTKQGINTLKYFIVTHSDADHEGGADVIITKFDIQNLYMCAYPKETKTHKDVLNAATYKNLKWTTPSVGTTFSIGSAIVTVIAPNATYDDPNNSSIAVLIQNGENKFLFTGDCEEDAEADIIKNGYDISADVYQVGHHGSNTSSSQSFLDKVNPTYAVISCGEGNSYGHPRAETLTKFQNMGIQIFRTDDQGTIIAYSDGTNITWNMSPSENWSPGEPTSGSSTSTSSTTSNQTTVNNSENNGNSETLVWLSATGSKYHKINNCGNMNPNKATQVTEAEAIAKGKQKCSKCW